MEWPLSVSLWPQAAIHLWNFHAHGSITHFNRLWPKDRILDCSWSEVGSRLVVRRSGFPGLWLSRKFPTCNNSDQSTNCSSGATIQVCTLVPRPKTDLHGCVLLTLQNYSKVWELIRLTQMHWGQLSGVLCWIRAMHYKIINVEHLKKFPPPLTNLDVYWAWCPI